MKGFLFIFAIVCHLNLSSQASYQYAISFVDKGTDNFSLNEPTAFLSQRSISRRINQGISIDESDLPISSTYLKEFKSIPALKIVSKSKWFNDIVVEVSDTSIIAKLRIKPFVKSISLLPGNPNKMGSGKNKVLDTTSEATDEITLDEFYGSSINHIGMLNADYLQLLGYHGEGMRIGIIDGGFTDVQNSPHFIKLFQDQRVIATHDFVQKDADVYAHGIHGSLVLSTLAAYSPGKIIGMSYNSEFVLLRSEDGSDEYLLEEYFWVEAAEFADSAGVDIINTSLGYTTFVDTLQNHTYADMNGITTRISIATDKAFQKGILLFNSAGNSGNNKWQKVGAPADAFDVITVGGVDSLEALASFSSRGPTSDNRLKPEVSGQAALVLVGFPDGSVGKSNGTSFSSPIMSGAASILWQANRDKTWKEIKTALYLSADRFQNPDTNYGYGIPDLILANDILNGMVATNINQAGQIRVFPNPFSDHIMLALKTSNNQDLELQIVDALGRIVLRGHHEVEGGKPTYIFLKEELVNLQSGLYHMKLQSEEINAEVSLIKD